MLEGPPLLQTSGKDRVLLPVCVLLSVSIATHDPALQTCDVAQPQASVCSFLRARPLPPAVGAPPTQLSFHRACEAASTMTGLLGAKIGPLGRVGRKPLLAQGPQLLPHHPAERLSQA